MTNEVKHTTVNMFTTTDTLIDKQDNALFPIYVVSGIVAMFLFLVVGISTSYIVRSKLKYNHRDDKTVTVSPLYETIDPVYEAVTQRHECDRAQAALQLDMTLYSLNDAYNFVRHSKSSDTEVQELSK